MRQPQVFAVLIVQGILMLLAVAVGLAWKGLVVAMSALWGGLAVLLPTALFAWLIFGRQKMTEGVNVGQMAQCGSDLLRKMATAWMAKFAATALIFALALLFGRVQADAMLLTFVAILLLYHWPVVLITDTNRQKTEDMSLL